jgi:hypothetical protein
MIYVSQPGQLCIKGNPMLSSYANPLDQLPYKLYWTGLWTHLAVSQQRGTLQDIDGISIVLLCRL